MGCCNGVATEAFLAYVTSSYRGMCKFSMQKNAFVERAGLLYRREMLAVSFDRFESHLFLVVGQLNSRGELCYSRIVYVERAHARI